MSFFKKLANHARQSNQNWLNSSGSSSSSNTGVRKVCANCVFYSEYGPHGLYACTKHNFNFSIDDVKYNNAPNCRTCPNWSKKW